MGGSWVPGSAASGLRSLSRLWGGLAFALCARGLGCSPPRLAPARSRSAVFFWAPRDQAYETDGVGPTYLHKRGHSLLCCCRGRGSAGPGLRSQGSLGKDGAFALSARGGFDRFQCLLRPGPAAAAAGRSLRGAVGPKGYWLIVCGRRRVVVRGWFVVGRLLGIGSEGSFLSSLSRDIFKRIRT